MESAYKLRKRIKQLEDELNRQKRSTSKYRKILMGIFNKHIELKDREYYTRKAVLGMMIGLFDD